MYVLDNQALYHSETAGISDWKSSTDTYISMSSQQFGMLDMSLIIRHTYGKLRVTSR